MISETQLYLAILAADSYTRGYDSSLRDDGDARDDDADGLGETDNGTVSLGGATVSLNPNNIERPPESLTDFIDDSKDVGLHALAYQIGPDGPAELQGKTVISCRAA